MLVGYFLCDMVAGTSLKACVVRAVDERGNLPVSLFVGVSSFTCRLLCWRCAQAAFGRTCVHSFVCLLEVMLAVRGVIC